MNSAPEPFFLERTALRPGTTLIEASAGTGKTYTITGLFLRLLLEAGLSVREILAVTYTEAATEELRHRVRESLAECVTAFTACWSDNPFVQSLLERHQENREECRCLLERALRGFDEAPIFTIHGFCQRTLKDRAFESGSLFDMELVTDPSGLLREVAEDYWRKTFYECHSVRVNFALKNNWAPGGFLALLETGIRHPSLQIISRAAGRTLEELGADLENAFEETRALWDAEKSAIQALFGAAQKKVWANSPYNHDEKMAGFYEQLRICFSEAESFWESLRCLEKFSTSAIAAGTGKGKTSPVHRFFELCEELGIKERDFCAGLQLDFWEFAKEELPRKKGRRKMFTFDDLPACLHEALRAPGGSVLAGDIRSKYRAALIDEFQDTDPVQYQIFRRIFSDPAHHLFLIGDPKQAIYGFRGADIFTYLEAAEAVGQRYTLTENWRSESGLVRAVNTIFSQAANPFVFERIEFHSVNARGKANEAPLTEAGVKRAPLRVWFWPREEKEISKGYAQEVLPGVVAGEIARLLNGGAKLGERKLRPEDMAVLVLENQQAHRMREALQKLGVPSVLHTTASLFETREAREVEQLLAAVARPRNEGLLKGTLATDLFGLDGARIEALSRDEQGWQKRLESFRDYHELWAAKGFIQFFRQWMQAEEIRPRLLRFPDGERRLTNLLHLGEVLHGAALEHQLGAEGLLKWLRERGDSGKQAAEEHQLRLERDENAVKLVTVHKSKGLEYPVVFCPFSWKSSELKPGGPVFFHDPERGGLVQDLGSGQLEEHKRWALAETLAENVRLLYVALTRAKHRCYFVWGAFNKAESSAPAWLLHFRGEPERNSLESLAGRFKEWDDEKLRADLEALAAASRDADGMRTIEISDPPLAPASAHVLDANPARSLAPRDFGGTISRDWRISSYSSWTAGHEPDLPDRDTQGKEIVESVQAKGIFAFPRGAKAGTCWHAIFEELNFAGTDETEALVAEKLRLSGFDPAVWCRDVREMVRNVLDVPLGGKGGGMTLRGLSSKDRLHEMEFYFPLRRVGPENLLGAFERHGFTIEGRNKGGLQIGKLDFQPSSGFLKGFIDLVFRFENRFYVVDWKSNWLGNRVEDYGPGALQAEMSSRNYLLQYHLYAAALDKFLELKVPGYNRAEHFGGIYYLFLRGVEAKRPEFGVYHDCPADELMRDLRATLWGES